MGSYITNGGHRDIQRIYPLMELEFPKSELFPQMVLQAGILSGAMEMLIMNTEEGLETAYAFLQTKSMYGYVMISFLSVYPTMRGRGVGEEFLSLIKSRYSDAQGILLEVTDPRDQDGEKSKKLRAYYERQGWREVDCEYEVNGEPATLLNYAVKGPEDIELAARRIVYNLFEPISGIAPGFKAPENFVKVGAKRN